MKYLSDTLVQLQHPVNEQDNTTIDAGTCNAILYHDAKDTRLSADEAVSGATTTWGVEKPGLFEVDVDNAVLERDDGTMHDGGVVTAIDVTAGTITVTNVLTTDDAAKGNRVMVQLGAAVSMSAYGTPDIDTLDNTWGFEGVIESSHADLNPGIPIRIEITLDASGVKLTDTIHTHVSGGV